MSNALDKIKSKIRNSNGASVHAQLIDTHRIAEESKQAHKPVSPIDVNENVNVIESIRENESAEINVDVHIDRRKEEVQETAAAILPPKREKRKKFEELYRRDTFWIRNELKDQLDAYCAGERGEKTKVINEALQQFFKKRK